MIKLNIHDDPFIKGLLERLPKDEHNLFNEEQLIVLKSALGARKWGVHAVDLRWTVKFWRWRYYFVFLAGVNQRSPGRMVQELELWGKAVLVFGFFSFSILMGLLVLYLVKSALGIDLIPGFSLGIWGWFQETFL